MTELALRTDGLTKTFHGVRAVDGIAMEVARGKIVGFLGPNGAGKTTVMNMVTGLILPDAGVIELLGEKQGSRSPDVRRRIGYLQEKPRIYPEMSAESYLRFFAGVYGVPDIKGRVDTVLDRVGLSNVRTGLLGTFSRGMQQRACLARVMLHEPEFLILDEPTLGLDPTGVSDMRQIFTEMRSRGATLLFSSHQLAEMERICDSIIFLSGGHILASGKTSELLPAIASQSALVIELFEPVKPVIKRLGKVSGVLSARETGIHTAELIMAPNAGGSLRDWRAMISKELSGLGLTVLSVAAATPSLEDLFLSFAGGNSQRPN
jgi:ABC-2 type transport system ATP-binding protein